MFDLRKILSLHNRSQDIRLSDFSSTVVLTKEDSRYSLLDKVPNGDRRPSESVMYRHLPEKGHESVVERRYTQTYTQV